MDFQPAKKNQSQLVRNKIAPYRDSISSDQWNIIRLFTKCQRIIKISGLFMLFWIVNLNCQMRKGPPDNVIVKENSLPGTTEWLIDVKYDTCSYPDHQFCRRPEIEGYASQMSLYPGDSIQFFVSTKPVSQFAIDIYRMGYYQGLGGNLKQHIGPLQGMIQQDPLPDPTSNFFECNWIESYKMAIPKDWLSGVYLCKLTTQPSNHQSYIIFIVKDQREADFIFQCSDLTWQAYNRWPTWHSLYDEAHSPWKGASGTTLTRSSFDRPYALYVNLLPSAFNPLSNGAGEFLLWEYPLSFWMEKEGYDVTYISNLDTDNDAEGLLRTKAFLSVGHDEYWTYQMVDNVKKARDHGVNLLFLSGNSVSGPVYLEPSSDYRENRTMGRPAGIDLDDRGLMGSVSYGVGYCSFICKKPDHWLFDGTGMVMDDSIQNLVGWEYHGRPAGDQTSLLILGENAINNVGFGSKNPENWISTIYTTEQGNFVFNAGTCFWVQPLAKTPAYQDPMQMRKNIDFSTPDPRVIQMTKNLLSRSISP